MAINLMRLELLSYAFNQVANDFFEFIEKNGLQDTKVDMGIATDKRPWHKHLCDTPACHGGWAAIMYGIEDVSGYFYCQGARVLAHRLGFSSKHYLCEWAHKNPDLWGNNNGFYMFQTEHAFHARSVELKLHDIADHYRSVSKRIRIKLAKEKTLPSALARLRVSVKKLFTRIKEAL